MACLLSMSARLWLAYKRTDPTKISVAAATMSNSTGRTMSLRILSSITQRIPCKEWANFLRYKCASGHGHEGLCPSSSSSVFGQLAFEQARARTICQKPTASLAARAVIAFILCIDDPLGRSAAYTTGLMVTTVHRHPSNTSVSQPQRGIGA